MMDFIKNFLETAMNNSWQENAAAVWGAIAWLFTGIGETITQVSPFWLGVLYLFFLTAIFLLWLRKGAYKDALSLQHQLYANLQNHAEAMQGEYLDVIDEAKAAFAAEQAEKEERHQAEIEALRQEHDIDIIQLHPDLRRQLAEKDTEIAELKRAHAEKERDLARDIQQRLEASDRTRVKLLEEHEAKLGAKDDAMAALKAEVKQRLGRIQTVTLYGRNTGKSNSSRIQLDFPSCFREEEIKLLIKAMFAKMGLEPKIGWNRSNQQFVVDMEAGDDSQWEIFRQLHEVKAS